jgi:dTDP-4-dehydrorhamnose 3,5-epimerase
MESSAKYLTCIEGVTSVVLREIADERGTVLHMLRCDDADFTQFGECYFSEVLPGSIKAWKRHRMQTQNLAAPIGRIRLVIFDDRLDSATKGKVLVKEIGRPDAYVRVKIPPGLWYGFSCIGRVPALLVNCADLPHELSESDRKAAFDISIPYIWQVKQN